jgi:hypothetical protein
MVNGDVLEFFSFYLMPFYVELIYRLISKQVHALLFVLFGFARFARFGISTFITVTTFCLATNCCNLRTLWAVDIYILSLNLIA